LSNAEKKVEKLEAEIADFESRINLPDFYLKPDSQRIMQDYERKKSELEKAMDEWVEAQEALEV
jgi:hypothetical protein